ncbi:MAG: GGDEF domain-containing phosphodiesterase [Coxiellaceae bacterium]|nr:GGDEF domain-containing phosphodiesterase [Coxiellaceae bacterium]
MTTKTYNLKSFFLTKVAIVSFCSWLLFAVLLGLAFAVYHHEKILTKQLYPLSALVDKLNYRVEQKSYNLISLNISNASYNNLISTREIIIPNILKGISRYIVNKEDFHTFNEVKQELSHLRWQEWVVLDLHYSHSVGNVRNRTYVRLKHKLSMAKNNIYLLMSENHSSADKFRLFELYNNIGQLEKYIALSVSNRNPAYYLDAKKTLSNISVLNEELSNRYGHVLHYLINGILAYSPKMFLSSEVMKIDETVNSHRVKYNYILQKTIASIYDFHADIEKQIHAHEATIYILIILSLFLSFFMFIGSIVAYCVYRSRFTKHVLRPIRSMTNAISDAISGKPYKSSMTVYENELGTINNKISEIVAMQRTSESHTAINDKSIIRMANYDQLTGLLNYTGFENELYQLLRGVKKTASEVIIIYLNLQKYDDFCSIFGELKVTHSISVFSKNLIKFDGPSSIYSKISPCEYLIAMPIQKEDDLNSFLAYFNTHINDCLELSELHHYLQYKVGIVQYYEYSEPLYDILQYCKFSSLQNKVNSTSHIFDSDDRSKFVRLSVLKKDITLATKNKQIFVVYQPQYSFTDDSIVGCEALVRWQHPEYGLISPAEFIPIAESTEEINVISTYMRRSAFEAYGDWCHILPSDACFKLSINASMVELVSDTYCDNLIADVEMYRINPQHIEVEITESLITLYPEHIALTIDRLKQLGMSIAIDDFGKEYSSLERVLRFNFDLLKIDKCFIDTIHTDSKSRILVDSIIKLAHSINVQTLAEGVETVEQSDILKQLKCDYVQGFYFAKPISSNEIKLICSNVK